MHYDKSFIFSAPCGDFERQVTKMQTPSDSEKERPIKICSLLLYSHDTAPGQRYRIEQWQPYLERKGIRVDSFPFASERLTRLIKMQGHYSAKLTRLVWATLQRSLTLAKLGRYDAVVIYRAVCLAGPAIFERCLPFLRRPIIYDFDDAIYRLHTSAANRWLGWLKFPGKTAAICRLSAHVTVGNAVLADYARQFNANVSIIPSSIDTERYHPSCRRIANSKLVLGWTGSSTSQTYLEMFAPVLRKLVAIRNVEIRVVSDREPILPGVPVCWRRWSSKTEVEDVSQMDIGIMPMPDEPWARGKCAFKALQYMALGIPAVCSPVGTNCEVIQHGQNGLLAGTDNDWMTHLVALIDDATLRNRLGVAGRHTVEQKYSMEYSADLFAKVVRKVVSKTSV